MPDISMKLFLQSHSENFGLELLPPLLDGTCLRVAICVPRKAETGEPSPRNGESAKGEREQGSKLFFRDSLSTFRTPLVSPFPDILTPGPEWLR